MSVPDSRVRVLGIAAWLLVTLGVGLPMATGRHFQVDELHNLFNARILATGDPATLSFAEPWIVPLSWIAGASDSSATILLLGRLTFLGLMLTNLALMAWGQPYFTTTRGRVATLFAAALGYELWRFGFELRHDGVLLTGQLALFGLTQRVLVTDPDRRTLVLGGLAGAGCCLAAIKGTVYGGPYLLLFLLAAVGRRAGWPRAMGWISAGFAGATALTAGVLAMSGALGPIADQLGKFATHVTAVHEYPWAFTLGLAAVADPALWLGAVAFLVLGVAGWGRAGFAVPGVLTRDTVTALYLLWGVGVIVVLNPTPYPYNLLHVMPFVFVAALGGMARLWPTPGRWHTVAMVVLVLTFGWRYIRDPYTTAQNDAQLSHIAAAEQLTGVDQPVLDGVGMVLTRPPAHPDWLLHSSIMESYFRGERAPFTAILKKAVPPVILVNYRWAWLPEVERRFIPTRYVNLSPNLLVLGQVFESPAGTIQIHRDGRYLVTGLAPGADLADLRIDGARPPGAVLELAAGEHPFLGAPEGGLAVHWIGPRLDTPPRILGSPGRLLLDSFY